MSFHPIHNRRRRHDGPPPVSIGNNSSLVTTSTTTTTARGDHSIGAVAGSNMADAPPKPSSVALATSQAASAPSAATTKKKAPISSSASFQHQRKKNRRGSPLVVDDSAIVGHKRKRKSNSKNHQGDDTNFYHNNHGDDSSNGQQDAAPPKMSSASASSSTATVSHPKLDQALAATREKKGRHAKKTSRAANDNKTTTRLQNGNNRRCLVAAETTAMSAASVAGSAAAAAAYYSGNSIPSHGSQLQPNVALLLPPPPPVDQQQQQQQMDEEQQQQLVDELAARVGARVYGPVGSPAMSSPDRQMNTSVIMPHNNNSPSSSSNSRCQQFSTILPPPPPPPPLQDDSSSSSHMRLQAVLQELAGPLSSPPRPPPPVRAATADVMFQNSTLLASLTSSPSQNCVASATAATGEEEQQQQPLLFSRLLDATAAGQIIMPPPSPSLVAANSRLHHHHELAVSAAASDAAGSSSSSSSNTASLFPSPGIGNSIDTTTSVAVASTATPQPALCVPVAANNDDDGSSTAAAKTRTARKPAAIVMRKHGGGDETAASNQQQQRNKEIVITSTLVCLVHPHDRDLISDRLYLLMQQFIPCSRRQQNGEIRGMCCKHCQGHEGNRAVFRKNLDSWAHKSTRVRMFQHVQECTACPEDIRNLLRQSQDTVGKFGNITKFFERILKRLDQSTTTAGENGDPIQAKEQSGDPCNDIYSNEEGGNVEMGDDHDPTCLERRQSTTAGENGDCPIQAEEQRGDINNEESGGDDDDDETGDSQYSGNAKEQHGDACDVGNNEESSGDETGDSQYVEDDPTCLVRPEDRGLVSERVYLMLQQFIPGTKSLSDPRLPIARGIVCKHCVGDTKRAPGSRHFPKSGDSLCKSHHHILKHVEMCKRCPKRIKDKICQLKGQDRLFQKAGRRIFYQRIIDRAHGKEWTKDADDALIEYIEQNGDDCEDLCEDLDEYPQLQRYSASEIRMRIDSEDFRAKLKKVDESNDQKPQAPKALVPVASAARPSSPGTNKAVIPVASVARPPAYDHPIFTQRGDFHVSRVYNAWCHEIDQERAKGASKANRVKTIVNAVNSISESIGINVAEVLKCFDELQMARRYCFTTVADRIDEFKRIVKGRLTGSDSENEWLASPRSLIDRQRAKQKGPPKNAPLVSSASTRALVARRSVKQQRPVKGSRTVVERPKLLLENDPEGIYIEERGFLFHDPKESLAEAPNEELVADLKPLPPPRTHPAEADFPRDSAVVWKYIEEQRVLLADFTQVNEERLTKDDIEFLAYMFERDDITCISQGLLDPAKLEERLWDCNAIRTSIGYRTHHKFKRFQQVGGGEYEEKEGLLEMPIEQFFNYLDRREAALDGASDANLVISTPGQPVLELDVVKDVLYMIDLDMPRILPRTFDDFVSNFKMKEILPGGKWCMMNALPASARPFMGPNMYITPGGGFTQLHQDGHGTCDSGHIALSGYNEVVMLRRLPERHKVEASNHLPNVMDTKGNKYDGMYGLPHDQAIGPGWPTQDTIAYWKGMNYCPSVFILTAGQHVHINKGRLHAFRKLTPETLPKEDCHYELRDALIKEKSLTHKVPTCVSIAWDWQFGGVHAEGIHRESVAILESALIVDQKIGCKCLAIPKAALLALGRQVLLPESSARNAQQRSSLIDDSITGRGLGCDAKPSVIDNTSVARGILPALRFLVNNNVQVIKSAGEGAVGDKENNMRRGKVSVAHVSDCNIDPSAGTVEPDGDDYFCKICHSELANLYFHCDGCEDILKKDFNICVDCHQHEKWKCTYQMCPSDGQRKSTINHTGDMPFQRNGTSRCPCKKGGPCTVCGFCSACSCVCHSCFTLHRRHYDEDTLNEILLQVTEAAGSEPPLPYAEYTGARLLSAADRKGAGLAAKRRLLAEYPRNKEQSLQILANGGGGGDDGHDDSSDESSVSRGDFSEEGDWDHDDADHYEQLDDRKMPAVDDMHQQDDEAEFADDIAILDSDAPSIYSSIMQSSSTSSTAGSVNDDAAEQGAVDNNGTSSKSSKSSSIPKEIYAAAAAAAACTVVESCVMEVEEAPRSSRRRKDDRHVQSLWTTDAESKNIDKTSYYFY